MVQQLADLQLDKEIEKSKYKKEIKKLQYEMLNAQQFLRHNNLSLILVFEGMDAAGKGGAIKRLTERLDPRGYVVHPIAAPRPHEKEYHYLHRFWTRLPQYGQIAIFDRSWYGRVLVERIEGFARTEQWTRAYGEINEFERQLTDENYIVLKFWLHVSEEEQLQRFEQRKNDPYKSWKLTDEDWRNREKFPKYREAADDMFEKTDKKNAPWILVEGNNKHYARVKVLREALKQLEKEAEKRGLQLTNIIDNETKQ
ncbi:MAG: polyphosphate kinase [Caryophanon sp.]|nr:polyphosphate kinase [Caryophanon sp.]